MYNLAIEKLHTYSYIYVIVVTWVLIVCLIYTPKMQGLQAQGLRVHISGKPRVPMLQLIYTTQLLGHQPAYITNKVKNIRPTITTRQYLLGYIYNFEMICGRVKQSTKTFSKNKR